MVNKIGFILAYAAPVFLMIALIPLVPNDYYLSLTYIAFIAILLAVKKEKGDSFALLFGLVVVTISEYFFIRTGVETFTRTSLWGVMPLWLPLLWGYIFVSIKRVLRACL